MMYIWVRIPSLDRLRCRCDKLSWRLLPGFSECDAVVWDSEGRPELWVRPVEKRRCIVSADKTLYSRAWTAFVRHYGHTKVEPSRFHAIDHLSPETAAFRQGYLYVRVAVVDAVSNKRVGSTVEKILAGFAGKAGGYQADWTTLAKVLGMQGSWRVSRPAREVAAELLALARANGMPFENSRYLDDLSEWIDFRRRGKKATDSGQPTHGTSVPKSTFACVSTLNLSS